MTPETAITRAPADAALARRDELTVQDLVAQVAKVQEVMQAVMKDGTHFGTIPGTPKPTLYQPGAQKLVLLFRYDPQYQITERETPDGHYSATVVCTLYRIGSGERQGSGAGSCSSRESRYAFREGKRLCPECGKDTIIKGKPEFGGGWLCYAKKGGCGAKWDDGAQVIEGQTVGQVDNPNLPDIYNTVLKIACKRALVAAVLNCTGASDIFTQDLEDLRDTGFLAVDAPATVTQADGTERAVAPAPAARPARAAAAAKANPAPRGQAAGGSAPTGGTRPSAELCPECGTAAVIASRYHVPGTFVCWTGKRPDPGCGSFFLNQGNGLEPCAEPVKLAESAGGTRRAPAARPAVAAVPAGPPDDADDPGWGFGSGEPGPGY